MFPLQLVVLFLVNVPSVRVFTAPFSIPCACAIKSPSNLFQCTRNGEESFYRSIGDVVGGLHGGKYQFDSSYGGTFDDISFNGSGYRNNIEEDIDPDEWPDWAKTMDVPSQLLSEETDVEVLDVPSNSNRLNGMVRYTSFVIQNEERTWEFWAVKILPETKDAPFRVNPSSGRLAPRGGATNACDPTKPYSDRATIRVVHDEFARNQPATGLKWWLVAGTEEAKWYYQLNYVSPS